MLKYMGHGKAFRLNGLPDAHETYRVTARVHSIESESVVFSKEKIFPNGIESTDEFKIQPKEVAVSCGEQIVRCQAISPSEAMGSIEFEDRSKSYFFVSHSLGCFQTTWIGPNRVWRETLTPESDNFADLNQQEKKILEFVAQRAHQFLKVDALALIGSRASRSHHERSDFDIVVSAKGGTQAWGLFRDTVRNESPSLLEIDLIDADSIQSFDFLTSVYWQGRFFGG